MSQTKTKVHPIISKLNQRGVVLFNSEGKITQITDPAIKLLFGTELSDKDIYTNDTYSEKLNENKKTIRFELAHKIKLRNVPDLMFIVDDVEEKAARVLKLFEQIEIEKKDDEADND